jgi:hypothetical protein
MMRAGFTPKICRQNGAWPTIIIFLAALICPTACGVLESGSGEATAEDREKLGVFGERLGLLVKGGEQLDQLLWLEDFPAPQAAVQRACEQAGQGNTVFIVSRLANFPAMELITDQLEALQL